MTTYDVVVAGGGPAGLACATQTARLGLGVCLVEATALGGQLVNIPELDSLPLATGQLAGWDLAAALGEQAQDAGVRIEFAAVEAASRDGDVWRVTGGRLDLRARTVVVATGTGERELGVAREHELAGRGISYCAACDGPLFAGRAVAVVGGDDVALREASYLALYASEVTVLLPDRHPPAAPSRRAALQGLANVRFVAAPQLLDVDGDGSVSGIRYVDGRGVEHELPVAAVFAALPRQPNTGAFASCVRLAADGGVDVDAALHASADGAFAAGDVRTGAARYVASAMGDGFQAAHAVSRYLATR